MKGGISMNIKKKYVVISSGHSKEGEAFSRLAPVVSVNGNSWLNTQNCTYVKELYPVGKVLESTENFA